MATNPFKIITHMVSSLDGIIAKKDNSISWFETSHSYDKGVAAENTEDFLKTIDCYVMGSHTYELALALSKKYGWAYGDKPTIVLTTRTLPKEHATVEFYSGNLNTLIKKQLEIKYKNVWVVGGSALVKDFIAQKLAHEIRISILPIILGEGLMYFDHIGRELPLHLKDSKAYKNGMIELCYEIV